MPPKLIATNTLFYGDNLDILREYFVSETVDLVYLDPPFNSNRNYNVLFADESGRDAQAQILAFEDTWHWSNAAFLDLKRHAPARLMGVIDALVAALGKNQLTAYLVMMAARLIELHRVLKPTGSLYLHCDPTASHYLKMILDIIFGSDNFRNEIIWKRTGAKALMTRRLPTNHDVLLYYQKTGQPVWNGDELFKPYDADNLGEKTASKYTHRDVDGRIYRLDNLINPNSDRPNLTYEFLGVKKVWRWTKERMEAAYNAGLVVQTKPGSVPQLKRYLDEQRGLPLDDTWIDIDPINSQAKERLGYPTQKPVALLERIIQASTNPGDVVLDPFCGCGTAIAAAQQLGRRWIGIDITRLAVTLQKYRLKTAFGLLPQKDYAVIGEPTVLSEARELATQDENGRYQFQWWALGLVEARPLGGAEGSKQGKKGSDRGIDGEITFVDDYSDKQKRIVVQVKSGKVSSRDIRDLRGTIDREGAAMGVFITLEEPTKDMRDEADDAGVYTSAMYVRNTNEFPRIQILTIDALLNKAAEVRLPGTDTTFKGAQRVSETRETQLALLDTGNDD